MQATTQTFSKIIQSDNANEHYHIPKYQRAYSWGIHNWEALFDDIDDNEPGHFIGSIICVSDNSSHVPGNDFVYELIDGQQRLTTLSLFLAAIHYELNGVIVGIDLEGSDDFDEEDLDELKAKKRSVTKQLIKFSKTKGLFGGSGIKIGKKTAVLRVQPSTQDHNLDDYLCILNDCSAVPIKEKEFKVYSYFGNRRMSKAYEYFYKRLPEDLDGLVRLVEKINQLLLVHISVNSHSNAFKLFETLNNRGVPLTALDIIKNKMLAEMEKQESVAVDDSYDTWQELLENVPEGDYDRFLRHFYNAFKHQEKILVKKHPTKATSSSLITIYESLIESDAKYIFHELIEKSKIYRTISSASNGSDLSRELTDLSRIGAVPSYALLLFLMSLDEQSFESPKTLVEIVQLLQKYFVRRNVTDTPGTRDLDQIMIDVIEDCTKHINDSCMITSTIIQQSLLKGRGEPAPLADFKEELSNNVYYYNSWMTRFLLIKLDEIAHTREYAPDLWRRNAKGTYVWTVEHVFPQGSSIPTEWVDMVAGGDPEQATNIQEECVHSLGNLTLSGYNSKLSNYDFTKKQTKAEMTALGEKISIGYKNGLYLNNLKFKVDMAKWSLSTAATWNQKHINARNGVMVEKLCDIYRFEGE